MIFIEKIFSGMWAQALGWTLLHSLWQVMVICGVVAFAIRVFSASSQTRYLTACSGLLLAIISSVFTYAYVYQQIKPVDAESFSPVSTVFLLTDLDDQPSVSPLSTMLHSVETHMFLILSVWVAGLILFSLRLLGSWWYVNALKNNSVNVPHAWSDTLNNLSARMGIKQIILLAESQRVNAPMVIGYLKPIVLVPVGMFSGLTTEEIETIFLHELAHIKRHDYLVNLLQSLIEILFFFNPFVWIISGLIRREREYCCDDLVVRHHGNVLAYAYALTRLEETRLTGTTLALSLGNNKNQLLYRIKRMMEKSFKPQIGRERILPVVLVTIGLICASWLSMKTDDRAIAHSMSSDDQDTVVRKNEKSASYSQQTITTIGENGEPQTVTTITINGDTSLIPKPPLPMDIIVAPDVDVIPPMPDLKDLEDITHRFMRLDTIPKMFSFQAREWRAFDENFEKQFSENFNDFYNKHSQEFDRMMRELGEELNSEEWKALRENALAEAEIAMEQLRLTRALNPDDIWKAHEAALLAKEEALREVAEWQREHADDLKDWSQQMQAWQEAHAEQLKEVEKNFRGINQNTRDFQQELKKMLLDDGYLKEGEELKDIHWKINGDIEINGKKIRESDNKKYQDLHSKHFNGC